MLYMFVVFPLLSVTIDWQEMEGSTYLATAPQKSINHLGYPFLLSIFHKNKRGKHKLN